MDETELSGVTETRFEFLVLKRGRGCPFMSSRVGGNHEVISRFLLYGVGGDGGKGVSGRIGVLRRTDGGSRREGSLPSVTSAGHVR
jgi:hypothetical protein